MISITVLFRQLPDQCKVAIGSLDLELGTPVWYEASPILGAHTFDEWEHLVRPEVLEFAKRLGIDPVTLHGGRLAYSGQVHAMMEFDFDSPNHDDVPSVFGDEFDPNDEVPDVFDDDETLGSCGCTDYHMADCPTRN